MIRTKACRELLLKLATGTTFSENQFENLHQMLATTCPSIVPFLDWLMNWYNISDYPRSIKILIKALAAPSSVCGFVPHVNSLHSLLKEIIAGLIISQHPSKLKLLQEECPVLFNASHNVNPSSFPTSWHPMLTDLLAKSMAPFSGSPVVSSSISDEHSEQELHYFPNLPYIRTRWVYTADKDQRKEEICNKRHPNHSLFLPGVFTIFCPHGNSIRCKNIFPSQCLITKTKYSSDYADSENCS